MPNALAAVGGCRVMLRQWLGWLESHCASQPGVQMLGFTQPHELPAHLAQATCLVLPSSFEPWRIVVHEATTAGLAVIAPHQVGATTYYVRDGQNGYIINPDEASLLRAMRLVAGADETQLAAMRDQPPVGLALDAAEVGRLCPPAYLHPRCLTAASSCLASSTQAPEAFFTGLSFAPPTS